MTPFRWETPSVECSRPTREPDSLRRLADVADGSPSRRAVPLRRPRPARGRAAEPDVEVAQRSPSPSRSNCTSKPRDGDRRRVRRIELDVCRLRARKAAWPADRSRPRLRRPKRTRSRRRTRAARSVKAYVVSSAWRRAVLARGGGKAVALEEDRQRVCALFGRTPLCLELGGCERGATRPGVCLGGSEHIADRAAVRGALAGQCIVGGCRSLARHERPLSL